MTTLIFSGCIKRVELSGDKVLRLTDVCTCATVENPEAYWVVGNERLARWVKTLDQCKSLLEVE